MKKLLNKKGMTLVEVIVVLVILAILAAILVPSMVGWINKAKEKTVLAEARAVYLAAQTIASEKYGTSTTVENFADADLREVEKLAGVATNSVTVVEVDDANVANGELKITKIVYGSYTFDGTEWTKS